MYFIYNNDPRLRQSIYQYLYFENCIRKKKHGELTELIAQKELNVETNILYISLFKAFKHVLPYKFLFSSLERPEYNMKIDRLQNIQTSFLNLIRSPLFFH